MFRRHLWVHSNFDIRDQSLSCSYVHTFILARVSFHQHIQPELGLSDIHFFAFLDGAAFHTRVPKNSDLFPFNLMNLLRSVDEQRRAPHRSQ
jgi:hypothetical protein